MVTYPESAPLAPRFDLARLHADLDVLRHEHWGTQRAYGQDGLRPEAGVDWLILPLRSIGGDPARTDPGGAGLDEFADTPWLAKTPYFREIIAAIRARQGWKPAPGESGDVQRSFPANVVAKPGSAS